MMRCQRYQPFMSAIEKWGSADQQSASPLLGHPRECGIEVVFGIRGENNELDIQARGSLVHVSHLELSARIIRMDEGCKGGGFGHHLMQQAKPFRFKCGRKLEDPGHVAARPTQ